MATKYATVVEEIVERVGGPENIAGVFNCQTRLRFTLKDMKKANTKDFENLDGVVSAMVAGGMFQVIVGTHVKDVFDELEPYLKSKGVNVSGEGVEEESDGPKENLVNRFISFISAVIMPVIPALAGAGMISALLALLVAFKLISTEDQTYIVLKFMADAVFYFLPIFLAFSAADKLKTSRVLAMVMAGMLLHPTWIGLVAAGEPVTVFGFIPLTLAGYSSSVIPILLVVWVQSYVEKFLNRIVPKSINMIVVPMLVFLVVGLLAFSVLGPAGGFLGKGIALFFEWLQAHAAWAPALLIGSLWPLMVMFGVHIAVAPLLFMQLAELHYDSLIGPGAIVANISMACAAGVVALRSKDVKEKQIATAGSITAFMGITEPALYGTNLPKRYPLIASMIGGAAGGLYAGITGVRRFAAGSSSLPALPLYVGDDTLRHLINIIIALVITGVVTVTLTLVLAPRFEKKAAAQAALNAAEAEAAAAAAAKDEADAEAAAVAHVGATTDVCAPVQGSLVPLAKVPDPAFAAGALGKGIGVEPADGRILAPVSGKIIAALGSGHAYGIRTDTGVEILVHIGVDTVSMKGEGFTPAVKKGDVVKAGELLASVDLAAIAAAGHPATIIVLVTNTAKLADVSPLADAGDVVAGEPILTVTN